MVRNMRTSKREGQPKIESVHLRLPADLLAWLDQDGLENERSRNAEMIYIIKSYKREREKEAA